MVDRVDATVARRVAIEAAPAGRPGNATEAALVNYLRPRATADPEQALKVMSIRNVPPREVARVFIDQQIGPSDMPQDPRSGLKERRVNVVNPNSTPFEVTLVQQTLQSVDRVYNFLERGTVAPELHADVLRLLYTDDRYRNILAETFGPGVAGTNALNANFPLYMNNPNRIPANIRTILDSVVRSEGFNTKLRQLLKDRIDITKKNDDPAVEIRSRLGGLMQEYQIISAELSPNPPQANQATSLLLQLNRVENDLLAYRSPVGGQPNQRAAELATWKAEAQTLENGIKRLQQQNTSDNKELQAWILRIADPNAPPEIKRLNDAIGARDAQIGTDEGNLQTRKVNIQMHEDELKTLQVERQRIITEIGTREKRRTELASAIATDQARIQPLENDRIVRERGFASSLNGIFADAAGEYLTERIQTIDQRYTDLMEKRQKTAGDEITRSVDELLKQRYFDFARNTLRPSMERYRAGGSFWFDEVRPINMQRVEQDMATYRRGGPFAIVNAWVGDQIRAQVREQSNIPPGTALNADQQREVRKRIDEVSESKSNDMILDMFVTRRRMGANISIEDWRLIQRYNPGIMKTVLERDATLRDEIVQLAGEGAITDISRLPDGLILKVLGGAVTALGLGVRATLGTERPY